MKFWSTFLHCQGLLEQGLWWGGTCQLFGNLVPFGDSQVGSSAVGMRLGGDEPPKIGVLWYITIISYNFLIFIH